MAAILFFHPYIFDSIVINSQCNECILVAYCSSGYKRVIMLISDKVNNAAFVGSVVFVVAIEWWSGIVATHSIKNYH